MEPRFHRVRAHWIRNSWRSSWPRRASRTGGPAAGYLSGAAGVDHPVRRNARPFGPNCPVDQPVQLAGGVRVGVDGKQAAGFGGQLEQPVRRVGALWAAVDLDGHARLPAGLEDRRGVELRLGPPAPALAVGPDQPPGAVPEHGHVRIADRGHHAPGHRPGRQDRKSTRLNSSHVKISYAVFCLKKKKKKNDNFKVKKKKKKNKKRKKKKKRK